MKNRKICLCLLAALLLAVCLSPGVSALTSEEYCIVFLSDDAPRDGAITLEFPEDTGLDPIPFVREDRAWETYFRFYFIKNPAVPVSWRNGLPAGTKLVLEAEGERTVLTSPTEDLKQVRNVFRLNWKEKTMKEGVPGTRRVFLIALRVGAGLLLELAAVWLFGYRQRRSWLLFIAVAAAVQIFLNAGIFRDGTTLYDCYTGWAVVGLLLTEFFVSIIKPAVFDCVVWEHGGRRAITAALVTNLLSASVSLAAVTLLPM